MARGVPESSAPSVAAGAGLPGHLRRRGLPGRHLHPHRHRPPVRLGHLRAGLRPRLGGGAGTPLLFQLARPGGVRPRARERAGHRARRARRGPVPGRGRRVRPTGRGRRHADRRQLVDGQGDLGGAGAEPPPVRARRRAAALVAGRGRGRCAHLRVAGVASGPTGAGGHLATHPALHGGGDRHLAPVVRRAGVDPGRLHRADGATPARDPGVVQRDPDVVRPGPVRADVGRTRRLGGRPGLLRPHRSGLHGRDRRHQQHGRPEVHHDPRCRPGDRPLRRCPGDLQHHQHPGGATAQGTGPAALHGGVAIAAVPLRAGRSGGPGLPGLGGRARVWAWPPPRSCANTHHEPRGPDVGRRVGGRVAHHRGVPGGGHRGDLCGVPAAGGGGQPDLAGQRPPPRCRGRGGRVVDPMASHRSGAGGVGPGPGRGGTVHRPGQLD